VGVLLRQMLTGRVVVPGISGSRPPSWPTMALLFAADRLDHVEAEIRPNLRDGVTVLTDRYDYSSVAYQSVSAGSDDETIEWVKNLNRHARRPDLTLVLDVDAEVAARRRTERSGGGGIYDDEELQKGLAKFYRDIEQHFPQDRIEHIDADRPIQEVAADVLQHVRTLRGD
jgi:dTMP kinase